jgi:hypothetical protein
VHEFVVPLRLQVCASQHTPEEHAPFPTQLIEQDGPLHFTGNKQAPAPAHSIAQDEPPHSIWALAHAACPAQFTVQSPLPQVMFPAGQAPVLLHSMSHAVALLQSTPSKQLSNPLHRTLQGTPAGHATVVLHAAFALQSMTHVSP